MLTVSDAIQSKTDTLKVFYLDNDAPVANAGTDISTCEYQFHLSAGQSYDVNWNELTYDWTSLDGLSIVDDNTPRPLVTSPTNLTEPSSYKFALEINDGFCSSYDTVSVLIAKIYVRLLMLEIQGDFQSLNHQQLCLMLQIHLIQMVNLLVMSGLHRREYHFRADTLCIRFRP